MTGLKKPSWELKKRRVPFLVGCQAGPVTFLVVLSNYLF